MTMARTAFRRTHRMASLAILAAGLLWSANAAAGQLYTSYNLFYENPQRVFSINYKKGVFLPAGTAVENIRIQRSGRYRQIAFTLKESNRTFHVNFTPKYHPGKSIQAFRDALFGNRDFAALTEGLAPAEIDAIRRGELVTGMSKRAVLICYGPPPEHATPSLDTNTWIYWTSRLMRKLVAFGATGRVESFRSTP